MTSTFIVQCRICGKRMREDNAWCDDAGWLCPSCAEHRLDKLTTPVQPQPRRKSKLREYADVIIVFLIIWGIYSAWVYNDLSTAVQTMAVEYALPYPSVDVGTEDVTFHFNLLLYWWSPPTGRPTVVGGEVKLYINGVLVGEGPVFEEGPLTSSAPGASITVRYSDLGTAVSQVILSGRFSWSLEGDVILGDLLSPFVRVTKHFELGGGL